MPRAIYIHVPFCISRCKYCSFVSFENIERKKDYICALLGEIEHFYKKEKAETIYFGGGTPSVFEVKEIEKILSKLVFFSNSEITLEINPNDADKNYLEDLRALGVNRLSIGAQCFDDNLLKYIGRRHNSNEIFQAVDFARSAGFKNISLDLIYGLPYQTADGFKKDLNAAISLDIEHISLYGLKIDKNCYFHDHPPDNLPDDDMQAEMYLAAREALLSKGFEHYEISNYSKPGYNSKHNMNYWLCGEYYGFGAGAHGFYDNIRYSNPITLEGYISSSNKCYKILTKQEQLEERIFLGLRLSSGINVKKINKDFGIDFDKKYEKIISKYFLSGFFEKTDSGYKLSDNKEKNGFLISNFIMSDFME